VRWRPILSRIVRIVPFPNTPFRVHGISERGLCLGPNPGGVPRVM
jgi:hypothetical protein